MAMMNRIMLPVMHVCSQVFVGVDRTSTVTQARVHTRLGMPAQPCIT